MEVVEFVKAYRRLCDSNECANCPLWYEQRICMMNASVSVTQFDESKVVSIVEQWAAEHPAKTRQSEFLKHYPNAKIFSGCLYACPMDVFDDVEIDCDEKPCFECKNEFWLAEAK